MRFRATVGHISTIGSYGTAIIMVSQTSDFLPPQRITPLSPGSRAENNLRQYLDTQLLQISGKCIKKFMGGGYSSIKQVASDFDKLVDILWISGSPSLQWPYLLQIADNFNDHLASFTRQLIPTFWLLDKLDCCFYTLVTGQPVEENMILSMASQVGRLNITERVRLRSVVERTRLHMVKLEDVSEIVLRPELAAESIGGDARQVQVEMELQEDSLDIPDDDREATKIEVARIYERTLVAIDERQTAL